MEKNDKIFHIKFRLMIKKFSSPKIKIWFEPIFFRFFGSFSKERGSPRSLTISNFSLAANSFRFGLLAFYLPYKPNKRGRK